MEENCDLWGVGFLEITLGGNGLFIYLFIYLFCLLLSFTVIFIRARNASFISYSSVSISILCLPYEFVLSTLLPIVENHFKQLPISAHLRDQMQPELFSKTAEIPNIFNLWKNCKF